MIVLTLRMILLFSRNSWFFFGGGGGNGEIRFSYTPLTFSGSDSQVKCPLQVNPPTEMSPPPPP